MFSGGRSKRRLREAPCLPGQASGATSNDQKGHVSAKKSLQLAMPHPPSPVARYYPGTSIPMNGWFHACRICRCWTSFSGADAAGEPVPLCRRCAPHHSKALGMKPTYESDTAANAATSMQTAPTNSKAGSQQYLAPAAAPATLEDYCQSPTAFFTASFLSPGFDEPAAQVVCSTSSKQPGSLRQHVQQQQLQCSSQSQPVPGQPATAAAAAFKRSHSSCLQAGSFLQQQQPPMDQQVSTLPAPHINARRYCSDAGLAGSSSDPQQPFFPGQAGSWAGSSGPAHAASASAATGYETAAFQPIPAAFPGHAAGAAAPASAAASGANLLSAVSGSVGQQEQLRTVESGATVGAGASLLDHWYSDGMECDAPGVQQDSSQHRQSAASQHTTCWLQQHGQQVEVGEQFIYYHK